MRNKIYWLLNILYKFGLKINVSFLTHLSLSLSYAAKIVQLALSTCSIKISSSKTMESLGIFSVGYFK